MDHSLHRIQLRSPRILHFRSSRPQEHCYIHPSLSYMCQLYNYYHQSSHCLEHTSLSVPRNSAQRTHERKQTPTLSLALVLNQSWPFRWVNYSSSWQCHFYHLRTSNRRKLWLHCQLEVKEQVMRNERNRTYLRFNNDSACLALLLRFFKDYLTVPSALIAVWHNGCTAL